MNIYSYSVYIDQIQHGKEYLERKKNKVNQMISKLSIRNRIKQSKCVGDI